MKHDEPVKQRSSFFPIPAVWALGIVLWASMPYIVGVIAQAPGEKFSGFTFNIDDACVYSSWIRQIADGNIIIENRFTAESQQIGQFNIFFIALGMISKITGLSPAATLHLARFVLGILLLWLIWRFSQRFLRDPIERMLIVPIAGLSSGLGWLLPNIGEHKGPVDLWQPEAITFLSIYLNPLFLAGLILMIASMHFLLRMKETGRWKDAVLAGLMLLFLANVHTYDVLTVGAVWALYLIVKIIKDKQVHWLTICQSTTAASIALPALVYQFYVYRHDAVFAARVVTEAPSPALWAYLMGYGLVLVFAVVGTWLALKERRGALVLVVWAAAGFVLPYISFAQQRKLVMGLHIPLIILAAIAISTIARRAGPKLTGLAIILMAALVVPSNMVFMARDIKQLGQDMTAPRFHPYLRDADLQAMQWLREHTRPNDVVLAFPDNALFTPAVAGNRVYYGHWSETPDYKEKVNEWLAFVDVSTPDVWRTDFLRSSGARYILYPSHPTEAVVQVGGEQLFLLDLHYVDYVESVFETDETTVFRVKIEPDE